MPYKVEYKGGEGTKFSFDNPDNPGEKISLEPGQAREFENKPEVGNHPYLRLSGAGKKVEEPVEEPEESKEIKEESTDAPKEDEKVEEYKPKKRGKRKKREIGKDRIG